MKGIAPAGAFNINNSCVIVATALKEFFVNGTPVEDTINGYAGRVRTKSVRRKS